MLLPLWLNLEGGAPPIPPPDVPINSFPGALLGPTDPVVSASSFSGGTGASDFLDPVKSTTKFTS